MRLESGKLWPLVCWALFAAVVVRAAPAETPPAANVVLLQNRQVLMGRAVLVGNRVEVEVGAGNVVRLPLAQVKAICPTLRAAYERLRDELAPDDLERRLDLAEWCVRQNLFAQSAEQLVEVMQRNPAHPRLPVLEERLRNAAAVRHDAAPATFTQKASGLPDTPAATQLPAASVSAPAATNASLPAQAKEEKPSPMAPALLGSSALEALQHSPELARLPRVVAGEPATHEVVHLVGKLPPETVGHFAETIQPLLLNRCASGGCHGNASTASYKLLRVPGTATNPRRFTQRNLYFTLQQIDVNDPAASPLLRSIARAHGTATGPIFHEHERKLHEQLVAWVAATAAAVRPAEKPAPAAANSGGPPAMPEVAPVEAAIPNNGQTAPAALAERLAAVARGGRSRAGEAAPSQNPAAAEVPLAPANSAPPPAAAPVDPLDPAPFNSLSPK